jgi:hypothetical protein
MAHHTTIMAVRTIIINTAFNSIVRDNNVLQVIMAVRTIIINTALNSITRDNNALQNKHGSTQTIRPVQASSFHVDNCVDMSLYILEQLSS